jgi:16S rRNA (guanine527-N7)-methyltransferase
MMRETASAISLDRIAELLVPFVGPEPMADFELRSIRTYVELLLKWNAKLNLTAIRDPEEIITRHFGESLFAARQLFQSRDSRASVIDVGSGAGFPGLPLKLWAHDLELTLVESNHRKATFLREVIRALALSSIAVLTERAESLSLRADLVTLRAVERFERILPVASALRKPHGRIALLIGEAQVEVAQSALCTLAWHEPVPIPLSKNRSLLIGAAGALLAQDSA